VLDPTSTTKYIYWETCVAFYVNCRCYWSLPWSRATRFEAL